MTLKLRSGALLVIGGMLAATPALATDYDPYGVLIPGLYTVRVDPLHAGELPAAGQCLIQGNNGLGGPERYMWGEPFPNSALCNFNNFKQFFDNGQALYSLKDANFFGAEGERAYVIVNKRSGQCLWFDRKSGQVSFSSQGCDPVNSRNEAIWLVTGSGRDTFSPIKPLMRPNHCLIFSNNGYDTVPQVYRWESDLGDRRWCGLGSMQELEKTGQGLFWLTWVAAG